MKRILVIGSLNMDMVIGLNQMPLEGETILGNNISHIPDGKGANQACAAGRLGQDVVMLGCVGDDNFGKIQSISLNSSGVDVTAFKISKINSTGTAVIYVDAQANNSIVVIQGANCECDIVYLEERDELLRDCDYVLLQMEIPLDTIYYSIKRAKELGKTVILNPDPAPDELPDEILKCIDYIIPNETELEKLTGSDSHNIESIRDGAITLLEKGVKM